MPSPTWNRALVTGASSGIGAAFARRLAADGTDLVLVARRADRLESLAQELRDATGVAVEVLAADLVDVDRRDAVAARLAERTAPVDLLVNNAGLGRVGRFHELDEDDQDAMVRLNVTALVALTHAAIPTMRERGRGGILNVASMVGLLPVPNNAVYAATKAFVISFTEALHAELGRHGIHVTCLNPGFTRSEFAEVADFRDSLVPGPLWMEADPVARAGLAAVRANRAVVAPGRYAAGQALSRLAPTTVLRKAAAAATSRSR